MPLTRSQLLAGDSSQGNVLAGQVQGVKKGSGVLIASDGTITFDASTAEGVVKLNNPAGAKNDYVWPSVGQPGQLTLGANNVLSWVVREPDFGLALQGQEIKVSTPVRDWSSVPDIGTNAGEATEGSLYWNSESSQLFICVSGSWVDASYGPLDLNQALLTGTYTLYVNPQIGSDVYVTGDFDPLSTPVVTNQMVTAGYTPQAPFRTIQRAALEVARIQVGLGLDPQLYDRFVIKCAAGVHYIDNALGSASVSAWTSSSTVPPTSTQLRAMNNESYAGVILPRGVSVIGEDLRKTINRPTYVPPKTGNIDNDRGSVFRITGGGFFFNFTFKDKEGLAESHHLLDCFSFVSDSDLVNYYSKVATIFAQSYPNTPVTPGETEIVAPQPSGVPGEPTDGVFGSSPYIFNCSVRSLYGLCGINANGNDVTGFRSIVTAQFTGVSLQKDLSCWQRYNTGPKTWTNNIPDYSTYIFLDPNNVRMDPAKRSFHIRAINNAFIQEVSVFAIGQGIHHWAKAGGELSITNSNSSFGGCAAVAEGYKTEAFPQDSNWNTASINLATNMADQAKVVNNINLGTVAVGTLDNATTITLVDPLINSDVYPGIPQLLASRLYTLRQNSYLWIENPNGPDWRAPLTASAWDPLTPDEITITVAMTNQDGDSPGGDFPSLEGRKVYVRRMIDTRTLNQRRYSITVTNTDSNTRNPLRDYVLQTQLGTGGGIVGLLPESSLLVVNKSGAVPIGLDPVVRKSEIVLERANPDVPWNAGDLYRPGDTVKYQNKHFTCVVRNQDLSFTVEHWDESYVHMPSSYNAYDFLGNVAPIIIFDNDTDGDDPTTDCGYDLTTCWATDALIIAQYTSTTDYRGVYQFLIGIGFTDVQVVALLEPVTTANRKRNPSSSVSMMGYVPNGAANTLSNWPVDFRRPSTIRMFGHSWEWAGFLNYTKALPPYQKDLSAQNQFTYYFTNHLGGKVYATGFNQEGYLITPAGLTDLSTGATIGITDIGNPFAGVDIPTYYPDLSVDNLVVNTSASFDGSVDVNGPINATNVYGVGYGLSKVPNSPADTEQFALKVITPVTTYPPTVSADRTGAIDGSIYWDNTVGALFIRYNDGDSVQWVQAIPSNGGNNGVPVGAIVMWSGTIASIPSGWALCDGTSGTPDLTDRFIVGANQDSGGQSVTTITGSETKTGGNKDAVVVSHSHSVTDPGHSHSFTAVLNSVNSASQDGSNDREPDPESPGATSSSFTGISIGTTGVSGDNQNLPPYYALAFIMKLTSGGGGGMTILNFPSSPVNGTTYTAPFSGLTYTYNATIGVWLCLT